MINILISGLISAIANRIRGGFYGDRIRQYIPWWGTTVSRITYGFVLGSIAYSSSGELILSASIVPTVWLGLAIGPFAPWQFMQRSNDILTMSLRGLILVGATSVAIGSLHDPISGFLYLIAGALMGPAYYIGSKLPAIRWIHEDPDNNDTNATSEVLFGLIQGLGLALVLS